MKRIFSIILLLMMILGCSSNEIKKEHYSSMDMKSFIYNLEDLPKKKRAKLVKKYFPAILEKTEFPIQDGTDIFFWYKGDYKTVVIKGDLESYYGAELRLKRVDGTDIFYAETKIAPESYTSYDIVVDGKYIMRYDLPISESYGYLLKGPDYNVPEKEYYKDIAHGKIKKLVFEKAGVTEATKDKTRYVHLYIPSEFTKDKKYKTIYFTDGTDYIYNSKIVNILDYMIAKGEIEPVIGVFIDWIDRDAEYIDITKDKYLGFIIKRLMPILEDEYSASNEAADRYMVGASNGGDFVCYVGYKYSNLFQNIFNQSGSPHYYKSKRTGEAFGESYPTKKLPLKVFSVVGDYEKNYNKVGANRFHSDMRKNSSIIDEKLVFYPQGHSWRMWGDSFREGILWLMNDIEQKGSFE